jgi:hypothetical protein
MNLFESAPKPDPAATRRLKDWTRELLALDEDVAVTVNELRCADEDCPDVETVIGALYGQGQQGLWTIDAPAAEVTREQLAAVFAGSPPAPLIFQRPTKNNNHPRT